VFVPARISVPDPVFVSANRSTDAPINRQAGRVINRDGLRRSAQGEVTVDRCEACSVVYRDSRVCADSANREGVGAGDRYCDRIVDDETGDGRIDSSTKTINAATRVAANLRAKFLGAELFSTSQIEQGKFFTAVRRMRLFLRENYSPIPRPSLRNAREAARTQSA
jgi:hypothetical protein